MSSIGRALESGPACVAGGVTLTVGLACVVASIILAVHSGGRSWVAIGLIGIGLTGIGAIPIAMRVKKAFIEWEKNRIQSYHSSQLGNQHLRKGSSQINT